MTNGTDPVSGAAVRSLTENSVNFSTGDGFYIDLPDTGERVNIDVKLQLGTLVVGSNIPDSNACNVGGYSWINYIDYATGGEVPGGNYAGQRLANSLVVGINIVRLPTGKTVAISTVSDNKQITVEPPISTSDPVGRRVTWREIVQ
jgi:type IV pilus assembly protein PilY1